MDATKTVQIYTDSSFPLTVTNGSGSGLYSEGEVVPISANPPDSGMLFAMWAGDVAYVADRFSSDTTVTMPAAEVSVTAAYTWGRVLTVNSGTGDGLYLMGTVVDISADPAPSGMVFDEWVGDTADVSDPTSADTTVTMPSSDVEVTATYALSQLPGDLNGDNFVGQDDLDIVLDAWGDTVTEGSQPDPSGDGFVGQDDLDIVLDNWGDSL
jgi:hypothetical protein